ncbi:MAG TPA: hypothetical protein VEA99_16485 [Gemmatimonadaceae bacterium]|nr:hypothetical protein [Gemmatimonadaceae bacterium]
MVPTKRPSLLAALLGLALAAPAAAQPTPATTLQGRHVLSIAVGAMPKVDARPGVADVDGMAGGLSWIHWTTPSFAVDLSANVHDAEARTTVSSSVVSLLVGGSWYPTALTIGSTVRPYLGLAVGPYIGAEADLGDGSASARTVFGARLSGGLDLFPTHWLRLGVRAAAHVAPDFEEPVGSMRSPSGSQLGLEVGWMFGGR